MKLYAIFANDNIQGITFKIFQKAVQAFKDKGYQIDELKLYDREKDIPFFHHDREFMESHPFYVENQKKFLEADTLLLVFPLYWYSVPAILKAWLDMINSWAYKYETGMYARPLHKIKKVFIIYSCMQDKQHIEKNLQNPVAHQLSETFKFIGISDVKTYIVDQVNKLNPEDISKELEEINEFCGSCA